jgi:hypothetical protein
MIAVMYALLGIFNQIVSVIEEFSSIMYISIRYTHLCSAINAPKTFLQTFNVKTLKTGLLNSALHTMSFWRDYHSAASIGLSSVAFLCSQTAVNSTTSDKR